MMRAVPLRRTAYSARRGPGAAERNGPVARCNVRPHAGCSSFVVAQHKGKSQPQTCPSLRQKAPHAPRRSCRPREWPRRCASHRAGRAIERRNRTPKSRCPRAVRPFPPSSRAFRFSGIPLFSYRNITASVPRSSKKSVPPLIAGQKKTPLAGRVLCVRAGRHIRRCGAKGAGGKYFPPAEPGAGPEVPTCDRSSPGWCGASARRERIRRR